LSRAYQATLSGMSVYRASRQYGVPKSTLRDRTRHNVAIDCRLGGDMLFTRLEQKNLVDHIVYMARVGYGYTITDIAYDYDVSIGKEVRAKEKLSQGWIYAFLGRWKEELKVVKPQKLTLAIAQCNQGNIDNYFKDLNKILDDHHLKTAHERIYIVDESGFSTEHSPLKIVCGSN